ncbi:copper resistance protein CopC [Streptomyces sp. MST-110588]|uniref:copper resistance CopC/CopD family protein n=1 Tax=Streptomyces sp. MST-110588 TaxID=2833628 RepID=UPI001F5CAEF8|nr:copper resistance protein CopC [Streptomyces sp. MST-110588]UNO40872.1 copper resistance protein CopC/CopD [Streptomyces sp. MST-110588]
MSTTALRAPGVTGRAAIGLRPVLRPLLLVAAVLGALLAGAAPASAHAALTGSTPAQGSVVDRVPEQVALTFSEGVLMGDDSIRVLDPRGKRVDRGHLRNLCSGGTVKYGAGLPPGLPDGTYTVAWQAVSADSHPVAGAFTFSVGAPSRTSAPLPQQEAGGGVVGALYGIARYLAYAGFVVLVGGAAFVLLCRPAAARVRSVQRLVVRGWAVLTAATIAMLLLRAPYTGSGDLADVFDLGGLRDVLTTKPGAALVSRLLLLAAAALFVAVLFGAYARAQEAGAGAAPGGGATDTDDSADATDTDDSADAADTGATADAEDDKRRKDLSFGLGIGGAILATGLAATWAMAEHASTGVQPGIAMPVDVLHLLAVATWLGGLVALLVSLYRGPAVERSGVQRFSRLAFGSVLVLVVTGIYQSWRQVGTWSALGGTSYGRLLLVKIGLVLVLVGIAWVSRRWTARLGEGPAAEAEAAAVLESSTVLESSADDLKSGSGSARDGRTADGTASGRTQDGGSGPDRELVTVPPDPARAAQLARQRAAAAAARDKRVRDADPERCGLRRSVLAEASVAVVLLAVTTVLTSTEPARTEEAVRAAGGAAQSADANQPLVLNVPFDTGGTRGKGTVRVDLDPARSGSANDLHLRVADPDGKTMDIPEVKVSFTLKAKGLGPLPVTADHVSEGHWSARGVRLPVPGQWRLAVTVRTSDIDQVTETRNVKIN